MPTQLPNPITIRPANQADTHALADLLHDLHIWPALDAEPIAKTQARLAKRLAEYAAHDSHTLIAAKNILTHAIDGYIAVHWLPTLFLPAPEAYISDLFIRANKRGQGIGGRLLAAAREEAAGRGCCRLMLLNNKERLSYQRGFYRKHGWRERENMVNFVYGLASGE